MTEPLREAPVNWTTCADCGDATPEVDAEEGICLSCWDGRVFEANARPVQSPASTPASQDPDHD